MESRGWIDQRQDDTGLTYLHARYYDPTLGTFLSPDPIGPEGGLNSFGYGAGNPANLTDRRGLDPSCVTLTDGEHAGQTYCGDGTTVTAKPTPWWIEDFWGGLQNLFPIVGGFENNVFAHLLAKREALAANKAAREAAKTEQTPLPPAQDGGTNTGPAGPKPPRPLPLVLAEKAGEIMAQFPGGGFTASGSAYEGLGGRVVLSVTKEGIGGCLEPGLGVGGEFEFGLGPGLPQSGPYGAAKVAVRTTGGAGGAALEATISQSGGTATLEGNLGPLEGQVNLVTGGASAQFSLDVMEQQAQAVGGHAKVGGGVCIVMPWR